MVEDKKPPETGTAETGGESAQAPAKVQVKDAPHQENKEEKTEEVAFDAKAKYEELVEAIKANSEAISKIQAAFDSLKSGEENKGDVKMPAEHAEKDDKEKVKTEEMDKLKSEVAQHHKNHDALQAKVTELEGIIAKHGFRKTIPSGSGNPTIDPNREIDAVLEKFM